MLGSGISLWHLRKTEIFHKRRSPNKYPVYGGTRKIINNKIGAYDTGRDMLQDSEENRTCGYEFHEKFNSTYDPIQEVVILIHWNLLSVIMYEYIEPGHDRNKLTGTMWWHLIRAISTIFTTVAKVDLWSALTIAAHPLRRTTRGIYHNFCLWPLTCRIETSASERTQVCVCVCGWFLAEDWKQRKPRFTHIEDI